MPEIINYLKSCTTLQQLSPHQLERLEARCRLRTFESNSPIYLPSENADSVLLLAEGLVKICHLTGEGKESIIAFIQAGELFGESALLGLSERDEYVETVTPATVVTVPVSDLQTLMAEQPEFAVRITEMIGWRRHRIERRLKHLLFLTNRQRLVHLLLDLAEQFGLKSPNGIRIPIKISHQELGSLIGSTRETVTVLLGKLNAEQMVSSGRLRIVLTDAERLARSVNRKPPLEARSHLPQPMQLTAGQFSSV